MLLTGDARGDYIIDGLERAGYLRNGPAKLDIVKLEHHGSARNTDENFFKRSSQNDGCSLLKQMRQQASARNASCIS